VLHGAHAAAGARLVPFAGYEMPVQYAPGVLKEHLWTRAHAGLFDVSHMGPARLTLVRRSGEAEADHRAVSALIEPLICGDIAGLKRGQLRYSLLLDEAGGVLDDLMIGRPADDAGQGSLYIVVNAGTKDADFALIASAAGAGARLDRLDGGGLIALQGPQAAAVLETAVPGVAALAFMRHADFAFEGEPITVSRSGYTGEDGFEILCAPQSAVRLWERLAFDERVQPIGLGARDSLRLEAGLPLYGHDIDPTISPIEASLAFAVSKRRLKAGSIRGSERLARELAGHLARRRVGLRIVQGAPAREGAPVLDAEGRPIGVVTSGGFGPSVGGAIAMAYVPPALAEPGTRLLVEVRGRRQDAEVVSLPFVPHAYHRAAATPA
jgi:aminomethyltransferase